MSRRTKVPHVLAAGIALVASSSLVGATGPAQGAALASDPTGHGTAGHDKPGHDKPGHDKPGRIRNPVVAHRGSPRVAPEETLASYEAAIDEGAAVLEGDVQLTRDGEPVLVHDDTLDPTTDAEEVFPDRAPWAIGDFTLAEIKQLDAGSWVHPKFADETIPTLEEVLDLARSKARGKVGFNLEMKSPENSPGVATKLAAVLEEHGLTDDSVIPRTGMLKVAVHSRDEAALHEFEAALPDVRISWLSGGEMLDDARLAELAPWTDAVYASPTTTTAADVERAHAVGLKVYSDPVDSPHEIRIALNQGYDYLVTNVPGVVRRVAADKDPGLGNDGVVIESVMENPSGDDAQDETGEYVALRNVTDRPVDISGHRLTDYAGDVWLTTGEDAVIQPGGAFRVYVNSGTDRADAHYNGHPTGIFDNSGGDTVSLANEDMELEDVYSYILP